MGWIEFVAAFAAFFFSHSIPVRPSVKAWLVSRIGPTSFTIAYSVLSLAVLYWLVLAAGRAPYVPLWSWAPWQNYVPLAAMAGVCFALAFSVGRPNPFSFGGSRNEAFDPSHPGIIRWTRHPILMALALWAAAHLVPNGDLAHVVLFGTFALFAVLGMKLVDYRKQGEMGDHWLSLADRVRAGPFLPRPASGNMDLGIRACIASALYLLLIWIHPLLFGVSPWLW